MQVGNGLLGLRPGAGIIQAVIGQCKALGARHLRLDNRFERRDITAVALGTAAELLGFAGIHD